MERVIKHWNTELLEFLLLEDDPCGCGTNRHTSVMKLSRWSWQMDLMILKDFSNLDDALTLIFSVINKFPSAQEFTSICSMWTVIYGKM